MQISKTKYKKEALEIHKLEFGSFYFFDTFLLAEIFEGVNFDWPKAQKILALSDTFYPSDFKPHYISNKINSYSIDPTIWLKILTTKRRISTYIIIDNNPSAKFNLVFEKHFFKGQIKIVNNIDDAIYCAKTKKLHR